MTHKLCSLHIIDFVGIHPYLDIKLLEIYYYITVKKSNQIRFYPLHKFLKEYLALSGFKIQDLIKS